MAAGTALPLFLELSEWALPRRRFLGMRPGTGGISLANSRMRVTSETCPAKVELKAEWCLPRLSIKFINMMVI